MAEPAKVPVKAEKKSSAAPTEWHPIERLRREIDHLFDSFRPSASGRAKFDLEPFWRSETTWGAVPAVDVVEKDKAFEITAELPGLGKDNVEVTLSNRTLTIKGEKTEEKEEKQKDYYLSERRYGSFQRSFDLPDGIEADKIEASFKNGVLTVVLPKSAEAQKQKVVPIKAA